MLPPPQTQQPPPPPPFSALPTSQNPNSSLFPFTSQSSISLSSSPWDPPPQNPNPNPNSNPFMHIKTENHQFSPPPFFQPPSFFTNHSKSLLNTLPFTTSDTAALSSAHLLSATALLQKAATVGAAGTNSAMSGILTGFDELAALSRHVGPATTTDMVAVLSPQSSSTTTTNTTTTLTPTNHRNSDHFSAMLATWRKNNDGLTRDFLGLTAGDYNTNAGGGEGAGGFDGDAVVGNMLKFTGELQYEMTAAYDRDNSSSVLLKPQQPLVNQHHHHHHHQDVEGFGFSEPATTAAVTGSRWG